MNTLYLQCNMGAAGDMLTAALYELLPNREEFLHTLNHMGLPGVEFHAVPAQSCGISGTHMDVVVHGEREESLDMTITMTIITSMNMSTATSIIITTTTPPSTMWSTSSAT